ncbi:2-succinyl-6-hydroxy-2,4-cyclohexadiene-1-carboxylate synthase [Methanosarcinaceae archaeon Ag5]|uniref:2-succinyl-6-hydroxy-2, 4-cyclohexadiene-1-carboxylate synthase n=1 Tax=Methanolapillus africanus TaxID=3028297 RepID=A0AAE4SDQ0_9EURY|nr:2-succinyl-6-hydroxy-2,4-cyclohexadiene-1-carboxylate synthase [Methanosarcinaceae archaeon Ag5]
MKIKVNGINLFYEKAGADNGRPLILLHGNGEDHHIFDELAEKLRQNFTVYAVDSRNHGESERTNDYSYETMMKDVYELIQALDLGPVNLIGFSDGAIISLLLAMKHGNENVVSKMALLGMNLKPSDFTDENYQYILELYDETKDPLVQLMLEQPNIELENLKKVTVPSLVVGAENDLFRQGLFEEIATTLPNAELLMMNGHEHDSYVTHQDVLYPELLRFFKESDYR